MKTMNRPAGRWYSPVEASDVLGVHHRTIRRMAADGRLDGLIGFCKTGARWRLNADDVDAFASRGYRLFDKPVPGDVLLEEITFFRSCGYSDLWIMERLCSAYSYNPKSMERRLYRLGLSPASLEVAA